MTNLLNKCLITDITAICELASTCAVLSCESVKWMTLHTPQEHGSSPLCIGLCVKKFIFKLNVLLHTSQQYEHSPICKRLCIIRLPFLVNAFLHTSQQYGHSSLCKCSCLTRSLFTLNVLLHTSQQYGRSPLIHLVVSLTTGLKPLPKWALHIVQSRASSLKWEYPLLSFKVIQ